jgi:hypothetical protein
MEKLYKCANFILTVPVFLQPTVHNLYFSIWYHNMLQSGKNQIYSTGVLTYLQSYILL